MLESANPFLTGSALDTLSEWSNVLKSFQSRIGQHFARLEARQSAFDYLQALMSPVERKNGWQMAEQVGHQTPYQFQHLLGRARWDAEEVSQEVRQYVTEALGREDGILAVDETGFIKQGNHSVGVQVQHCSLTGRLENCQVGVFLAYVSLQGHSLIDRRLYLPQSWCNEADKRAKAGVPETIKFATKPQLAQQMLESAFAAGIRPKWVVADEVYGNDGKFWWWLEQHYQQPYLLTVASSHGVMIGYQEHRVKALAQALPHEQWQRLSCGDGTKGDRIYDWARIAVNCSNEHGMKRWILLRRNIEKPDDPLSTTYYQVYAPADTTLEEMVLIAGQRWRIEECFGIAKDKLGLSEYEVRSWVGWHRHMTLVMAAQAFLTVLRHHVEPIPVPKKVYRTTARCTAVWLHSKWHEDYYSIDHSGIAEVGLETAFPKGLLIRAGVALVHLAQNSSSHGSLLPLPEAVEPSLHANTTVILKPQCLISYLEDSSEDTIAVGPNRKTNRSVVGLSWKQGQFLKRSH